MSMDFEGVDQDSANYEPLSPISFLERASFVYEKHVSVVYNDLTYTWRETYERCVKLASALSDRGVKRQDVVAALAPNIPALYELHFSVPMAGAILCALNTSLDSSALATKLQDLQAKFIFVDYQSVELVLEAFTVLSSAKTMPPCLVMITETNDSNSTNVVAKLPHTTLHYNQLLSLGRLGFKILHPGNECDPISISYTSGSTGKPKGVVYSHRAAYLNSLAVIFRYDIRKMPVFLWTVDMFRCNGWCFPWAVAALGGTNICIREVSAKMIFDSIIVHKVTHIFGAPTILDKIANSQSSDQRKLSTTVDVIVAGPLPTLETLLKVKMLGFNIYHGYGMTEALGPMVVRSIPKDDTTSLYDDEDECVRIKCREGTHSLLMEEVDVKDPKTMKSVPPDGKTIGEVMFKGNLIMLGYFKNKEETRKAFKGGWYRTGDLGTKNPDGDIEMKDRVSDGVVVEGHIVSTIEVERVIKSHPMVKEAAIVGKNDNALGETLCAFVTLKEECSITSNEIIKFCEDKLSRNMMPKNVYFGSLPVNSTGKIQKFVLREKAKAIKSLPHTKDH